MSTGGTQMYAVPLGDPAYLTLSHTSLDTVLEVAANHHTSPICTSYGTVFGPLEGRSKAIFCALVVAVDASGQILASWASEPIFETAQSAYEHATDAIGCEI